MTEVSSENELTGASPEQDLEEAYKFLNEHKQLLKRWVWASNGLEAGDDVAMRAQLERNLIRLWAIAEQFPQLEYAVIQLTDALGQGDKSAVSLK